MHFSHLSKDRIDNIINVPEPEGLESWRVTYDKETRSVIIKFPLRPHERASRRFTKMIIRTSATYPWMPTIKPHTHATVETGSYGYCLCCSQLLYVTK